MEAENQCVLCEEALDNGAETVLVKSKGMKNIVQASLLREDGIHIYFQDRTEVKVHTRCRKPYTNVKSVKAAVKKRIKKLAAGEDFGPEGLDKTAGVVEHLQKKYSQSSRVLVVQVKRVGPERPEDPVSTAVDAQSQHQETNLIQKNPVKHRENSLNLKVNHFVFKKCLEFEVQGKCVLCEISLNNRCETVKEFGLWKLVQSSIQRDDGKAGYFIKRADKGAEIQLHKKCIKMYNNPECIAAKKKAKSTKTIDDIFDFKNKCVFCGENASTAFDEQQENYPESSVLPVMQVTKPDTQEAIIDACKTNDNVWSRQVYSRIKNVNIMEKNAKYHIGCYSKFCHPCRVAALKDRRKRVDSNVDPGDLGYEASVAGPSTSADQDPDGTSDVADTTDIQNQSDDDDEEVPTVPQLPRHCTACGNPITSGYQYACVQCANHFHCECCEARRAHPTHYTLRIPPHRPLEEITAVLQRIRAEINEELATAEDMIYVPEPKEIDEIKTEPDPLDSYSDQTQQNLSTEIMEGSLLDLLQQVKEEPEEEQFQEEGFLITTHTKKEKLPPTAQKRSANVITEPQTIVQSRKMSILPGPIKLQSGPMVTIPKVSKTSVYGYPTIEGGQQPKRLTIMSGNVPGQTDILPRASTSRSGKSTESGPAAKVQKIMPRMTAVAKKGASKKASIDYT